MASSSTRLVPFASFLLCASLASPSSSASDVVGSTAALRALPAGAEAVLEATVPPALAARPTPVPVAAPAPGVVTAVSDPSPPAPPAPPAPSSPSCGAPQCPGACTPCGGLLGASAGGTVGAVGGTVIGGVAGLVVAVQAARQDSDGGYLEPFFDVAAWIIGTAVGAGVGNIVGFVIGASTGGFICGGVGAMVDPARPEENQAPPPAPAPAPAGQSASTAAAPLRF